MKVKTGKKYISRSDIGSVNPLIFHVLCIEDGYVWHMHYFLKDGPPAKIPELKRDMNGVRTDHFTKNWISYE